MKTIKKIILKNFKRFQNIEVDFDSYLNVFVGDNESGKSTILQAIDIVLSGSRNKVENIGLENLFNNQTINDFMQSDRNLNNMPKLFIEIYLNEQNNFEVSGDNNSKEIIFDGLKLVCEPNHQEFSKFIKEVLSQPNASFPFEYYSIKFSTFADQPHNRYTKYLRHIIIDNSSISSEYAMKGYVGDIYNAKVQNVEKLTNQHKYREHKENFKNEVLSELNNRLENNYTFSLNTTPKSNLETDLTIKENDIFIEHKGKGKQCVIKTELALQRNQNLDIVLIEEPENHLSHINMQKLIHRIRETSDKQIFIATHSDLISARLDLRKTILLNSNSTVPLILNSVSADTAKFFMKAPNNNILQFILSKKVILVEGDAEYILMEAMYQKVTNEELNQSDIHIISVGGKRFKRYLDLARMLEIKTAIIIDNDGDYQKNCVDNYSDYLNIDFIQIFSENNNELRTFEICLYSDNQFFCNSLFRPINRTVIDYMLDDRNKADCAFKILENHEKNINVPQYITEAIQWIRE